VYFLAGSLPASLHARLAGPQNDDVVPHVEKCVQHASAKTLSVCQQQHDRDESPSDAKHGER
jgi:hypothetical protein